MSNRAVLFSAVAIILPIALTLIVVLLLARPASLPTSSSGVAQAKLDAGSTKMMPTKSAGQAATPAPAITNLMAAGNAAQTAMPTPAPAAARPKGPPAPELIGGGAWI